MLAVSAVEIGDLTVLALTSFFEESVLEYVYVEAKRLEADQTASALALVQYAFRDVERWSFVSILGLFRSTVDPQLVDQVVNVYKYRNWVAHGKKTQKPVLTDPIRAHRVLTSFLLEAGVAGSSSV